jgi:RNA polymerase sigma factor (sigma-70 family)
VALTLEALIDRRTQSAAAVVTSDGAAWSWPELFDHFAPAIHSFARSRGVSSPEDIVQDVFAAAVERFPRFEGDSSGLRSFFFTLAYRRIADEHRSSYRRPEKLVADHVPTADESVGIEDSVTEVESAREAMQALDILNRRERRVIEMRIIDEASPAEVAVSMGLSNGNVRVIQARALMKIRKYLDSKSGSMPSIGLVFAFARSLRTELPADVRLAAWMDPIHAESTRDPARVAAAGASSATAAGSASTTTIAGAALKVGLVVALATASTSVVDVDDPAGSQVPTGAASVVQLERNTHPVGFTVPSAGVDAPNFDAGIEPVAPNRPDLVPPSEPVGVRPSAETDQTEEDSVAEGPEAGSDPDGDARTEAVVSDLVQSPVEDVADTVDDAVNGLVDTVDTVVEDVVVPVVDAVVEVVDDTVTTVTDTVVDTVDTVAGVVDDTTNTVDDSVETLTDVVDDALGGLLG